MALIDSNTGERNRVPPADANVAKLRSALGELRRSPVFESIKAKIKAVRGAQLQVIYCCGEPNSIREAGTQEDYVFNQLNADLFDLAASELAQVSIAYEPIWAIGTGKTASPEEAQEMHRYIRNVMGKQFGRQVAQSISILYGGSVKASNAGILACQSDIDGFLVGGSSLDPNEFATIAKSFE